MRKSDLLDDSALINAFDEAIDNYKKMHGRGSSNCSADVGTISGEKGPPRMNQNCEADRFAETDSETKAMSKTEEVVNLPSVEEIQTADTCIPQNHTGTSDGAGGQIQSLHEGGPGLQEVQDYNHLLGQYYEIEEHRQRIWQKLEQVGTLNYQCSNEGAAASLQGGTSSAAQEYQAPTVQASLPTVTCTSCCHHCQYACSCTPAEFCSLNRTCAGKAGNGAAAARDVGKVPSFMDGDIIKNAMGAAAEAISFMEKKTTADSKIIEGQEREEGEAEDKNGATAVTETDLTVVLKAWYSAGFYTAKYLMEQEAAKKRHG